MLIALLLHWGLLYQPAYLEHEEMGHVHGRMGGIVSLPLRMLLIGRSCRRPDIGQPSPAACCAFGSAATVGHGCGSLGPILWPRPGQQESGQGCLEINANLAAVRRAWHPRGGVCLPVQKAGVEDLRQLQVDRVIEAGVLPEGVRLDAWEDAGDFSQNIIPFRIAIKERAARHADGAGHGVWAAVRWVRDHGWHRLLWIRRKASRQRRSDPSWAAA